MENLLNKAFFKLRKIELETESKIGIVIPILVDDNVSKAKIKVLELNGSETIYNTEKLNIIAPRMVLNNILKDKISDVIVNLKEIHKCKMGMLKNKSGYTQEYLQNNTQLLKESISNMVIEFDNINKNSNHKKDKKIKLQSANKNNDTLQVKENKVIIKKYNKLEYDTKWLSNRDSHKIDYSFLYSNSKQHK